MRDYLSLLEGLQAGLEGPISFRFLPQPSIEIFVAVLDGSRDAQSESLLLY